MDSERPIYLDHHATTPCDPRVIEAMIPYFGERFGNPSERSHRWGQEADRAVEAARIEVARLASATVDPREIIFTSGATEAINLAMKGLARAHPERSRRIVVSAFEHKAVLEVGRSLGRFGYELVVVSPSAEGFVTAESVRQAIGGGALMVCIMAAQNEVGTVQPLAEIGQVTRAAGAFFFVDAAQAAGKVPLDLREVGADLAAVTAHKLYGPKGVGALWVRRERHETVAILPEIEGSSQERGLRAGTLNVPGIVAFGVAARVALDGMAEEGPRLAALRARLLARLRSQVPTRVTGAPDDLSPGPEPRLPGNLHVSFPGVEARRILEALPEMALSTGSACNSAKSEGSHVLRALGLGDDRVFSSLRLGLGRWTTEAEVDRAADAIANLVLRFRKH